MANNKLELILTRFNNWDSESEKEEYVDILETLIESYNKATRDGNPIVPDAIYDTCIDYLRELKSDSYLLHQVWSADDSDVALDEDLDQHMVRYPMLSIQTIKHITDKPVKEFQSKLPAGTVEVCASIKENGHGGRIVYDNDGFLVKANSRGRSTNGKDLTNQMQLILGEHNPELAGHGVIELRCEILLPFHNLAEARKHNAGLKSAFSAVASMIRASATPEETRLLDVVVYDIISEHLEFETLSGKFEFLSSCGYLVPEYFTKEISRRTLEQDIEDILLEMDVRTTDYDYYTDGVIVAIDDVDLFNEFGAEDKFRLGNLAIKMGRWKQDAYVGIVGEIKWENGKSRKTPVAVLEEPVLTATGNSVQNIPLYAPLYIMLMEAYPGNPIHFRYGGEAGVIPIMPDGRLVTDKDFK
jgi:NAD-dependent DNA ligase